MVLPLGKAQCRGYTVTFLGGSCRADRLCFGVYLPRRIELSAMQGYTNPKTEGYILSFQVYQVLQCFVTPCEGVLGIDGGSRLDPEVSPMHTARCSSVITLGSSPN